MLGQDQGAGQQKPSWLMVHALGGQTGWSHLVVVAQRFPVAAIAASVVLQVACWQQPLAPWYVLLPPAGFCQAHGGDVAGL